MIVSIGTDIIEVDRIRNAIARTPRFASRVFTGPETAYCNSKGTGAAQSFASRWAAKEAFLKAIRTGWRGAIKWHDVEVISDAAGAPSLSVTGEAAQVLRDQRVTRIHLSMSHTADHATAFVILESDEPTA